MVTLPARNGGHEPKRNCHPDTWPATARTLGAVGGYEPANVCQRISHEGCRWLRVYGPRGLFPFVANHGAGFAPFTATQHRSHDDPNHAHRFAAAHHAPTPAALVATHMCSSPGVRRAARDAPGQHGLTRAESRSSASSRRTWSAHSQTSGAREPQARASPRHMCRCEPVSATTAAQVLNTAVSLADCRTPCTWMIVPRDTRCVFAISYRNKQLHGVVRRRRIRAVYLRSKLLSLPRSS